MGRISRPSLAMALMAMTICNGVTATPWPMGIWAMDTLLQSLTGCTMPRDFARQRDAGALAETKVPGVLVEPFFAEADADFGRADVGGFGDDVLHRAGR